MILKANSSIIAITFLSLTTIFHSCIEQKQVPDKYSRIVVDADSICNTETLSRIIKIQQIIALDTNDNCLIM